jgi:hypothetical protein
LNHHASPEFWQSYRSLPTSIQRLADRCYELLKRDPRHPSLNRALAIEAPDGIVWFWIGAHAEYDKLIG